MTNQGQRGAGHIRVACHGAPATALLPEAISFFVADQPEVRIDILVRNSFQVAQRVENRQIDIGILETPMARTSSVACHLDLPCVCLMTADHPLAERGEVTLTDLARHQLIGVLAGHAIDVALDRAAAEASVQLRRTIHGYLFVTMRRLVAKGIGVAVVDAWNAVGEPGSNLVWRPLVPEIRYEMSVVRRPPLRLTAGRDGGFLRCLPRGSRAAGHREFRGRRGEQGLCSSGIANGYTGMKNINFRNKRC